MSGEARKKILVGDTESWALNLIEQAAAKHNIELHTVRNGVDAVEKFKTLAPAIVIMDTLLPKLDGLQVASKIHDMELGRITPIIVTSAIFCGGPEVEKLRRNFGFTDFLEKPFQLEQIDRILGHYLSEEPEAPAADKEADEAGGEPMRTPELAEMRLSAMGIPALLMQLNRARKNGILTLRRGEITKVLFLEDGTLTHARSNSRRDLLGRILLRSRRIGMDDYDRARQQQQEASGHMQLGAALAQLGVLTEDEVVNAVSGQVLGIVFSLFSWREGTWSFLDTTNVPLQYKRFSFNPGAIVFWGLRGLEGQASFAPYLPAESSLIEVADTSRELKESLHLTYFEEQIVGLVDGRHSLTEILSIGRLAHLDVERVLFALLVVGVLRVKRSGGGDVEPELEAVVDTRPLDTKGDLLHTSVARLFSRIYNARVSGKVMFAYGELETSVWFDRGEIVYALSTAEEFRLASILLRANKVSQADYDTAMEMLLDHTSKKTGAIFLELRALSLDELHWALRFQVQAIVMHLFQWNVGSYTIQPGEAHLDLRVALDATTPNLIMEGTRNSDPPPGIVSILGAPDTNLVKVWGDYRITRLVQLSSAEMRLLSFIDVGRSVLEVQNLGLMSEAELSRSLHGLLALEIIKAMRGSDAELTISQPIPAPVMPTPLGASQPAEEDEEEVTGNIKLNGAYLRTRQASAPAPDLKAENNDLRARMRLMEAEIQALKKRLGEG